MKIKLFFPEGISEYGVCGNCHEKYRAGFLIKTENRNELWKIENDWEGTYWANTIRWYKNDEMLLCYSCATRYFAPFFYKLISRGLKEEHNKFELTENFFEEGLYITESAETEQAWLRKSAKKIKELKEAGKIIEAKPEIV